MAGYQNGRRAWWSKDSVVEFVAPITRTNQQLEFLSATLLYVFGIVLDGKNRAICSF